MVKFGLSLSAIAAAGLLALASPAAAAQVAPGTVTVAALYVPVINLSLSPNTYSVAFGSTFETAGTGGFSGVAGGLGKMNGTLKFSSTPGVKIDQSVPSFFTFQETPTSTGSGYVFSVNSVTDQSYTISPGSNSISLYLLGSTTDPTLGLTSAPTSLTLTFNSTGGSGYSASATLAVPPVSAAPEPGGWTLMFAGVGLMGAVLRRRKLGSGSGAALAAV